MVPFVHIQSTMIAPLDLAWLAGLIEGEGYMRKVQWNVGDAVGVQMGIAMCDRDVIDRVARLWESNVWPKKPSVEQAKPQWATGITGQKAIGWMMTLYPFLGERRQERIREVLEAWKARPPRREFRPYCPHGHQYVDDNVIWFDNPRGKGQKRYRVCRACFESARVNRAGQDIEKRRAYHREYYQRRRRADAAS